MFLYRLTSTVPPVKIRVWNCFSHLSDDKECCRRWWADDERHKYTSCKCNSSWLLCVSSKQRQTVNLVWSYIIVKRWRPELKLLWIWWLTTSVYPYRRTHLQFTFNNYWSFANMGSNGDVNGEPVWTNYVETWPIRCLICFALYAAFLLENHRENNHKLAL